MSSGGSSTVSAFVPESGMTQEHFERFQEAAQEEQVIALVRHTNLKSTELIRRGCPGKPMSIKIHTSDVTGVVTASTPDEIAQARGEGYLVVEPGGRLARGYTMVNGRQVPVEMKISSPFWMVAPGQLIDPKLLKPLVGDYDLMGVIEPRNRGQNIALVASGGERITNVESPIVRRFKDNVNSKLDIPRVHHGAQDQYADFRGGATVFFPDGRVLYLPDAAAVQEFYDLIGRQTRLGSYPSRASLNQNGIRVVPAGRTSSTLRDKSRQIASNQAAMEWLGQMLGSAIQWLGDIGIRRQIEWELKSTHAKEIEEHLSRGDGVLVIIRMQEWIIPDFNGMRARGLLGVYVEGGRTQQAALEEWQKPKIVKGPPLGWRSYEEYFWLDPSIE